MIVIVETILDGKKEVMLAWLLVLSRGRSSCWRRCSHQDTPSLPLVDGDG
jgi:hypothetical protein